MGISRSELFPGFNRYTTEWKSPPYGCHLGPIGWNTNTRRSVAEIRLTIVNLPSWMQEDTHGKSEMMILSKSQMKPSTNLCSQSNITALLSFWYDKWFSLRNEYDHPFEMRICTCVIQPFGSLQVVIRIREWQAAGSRIRRAQTSNSRCQDCPFDMINNCLFEMIYDSHFESRAVSMGRSQIETARRRGRRAVISRA